MSEPVWFVVERGPGGASFTSLSYDRLPSKYQGKRAKANGLITAVRIDTKPHLIGYSHADLHRIWQHLGEAFFTL